MKIKSSLRNKLIVAIFLGCLIPYILGGLYLKSYMERWLYNNNLENTNQLLYRISDLIDESLAADMEEELNLLSSLSVIKDAKNNLQNYTQFEGETFHYRASEVEKAIEEQFRLVKISHKAINFVFLGTEDGGYMEYPRFQAENPYEPRLRPWYQYSLYSDDVMISEPYRTEVSGEMVVSFTKRVSDAEGKSIGVLGVTVNLNNLTTRINNIKLGYSGHILIMSPNHKFLVSPTHPEWIMQTPAEAGLESFKAMGIETETVFEAELDGVDCVINVVTSDKTGWHIISVADKNDILKKADSVTRILLTLYAMTFVLIVLIVFQISRRFTTPVLEISSVINRMTDFDFNMPANLKTYAGQRDEIGTVAAAMVDMHDNYTEFMDQVNYINKEIQQINIEKNELLTLEVSRNNPFRGVIDSMNVLLAKIHQYFDELKETNKEVVAKNEQLTRSKKELMEQLEKVDRQNEYINFLALHDPLTKLPNRRQFTDLLNERLAEQKKGAVLLLDLDDFKGINDTRGHVFGDRVIEHMALRLSEITDEDTIVSRFGGDEFLVMKVRKGIPGEIDDLIGKIRNIFSSSINIDDNYIEVRFSMGISLFPEDGRDVDQLVMNADLAMYSVKGAGKNGYQYFDNHMMNSQIIKSKIETLLKEAIENDGFDIVYQPQIDLRTCLIYGYEALLRLKNSDLSPGEFVPIAEINGSIARIGRIVTEKVIRQLALWKQAGLELKPVSINFSANQLHDSGYLNFIQHHLKKNGIEPRYIEIEITESIFLENRQATMVFLKRLKEMGIAISIDDFGTGYSSLNYLTFLPVDKIKLDRSLNLRFLEMENTKVMDSLISLVHSLGLTVIAEGIETIDQVERLREAQCDYVQGYYYSQPLAPDQVGEIHLNRFRK